MPSSRCWRNRAASARAAAGPPRRWCSRTDAGRLAAALPAYLKEHSQGEYVFDHSWADAWHRAGGHYYPKLQIAAPFTPATGPRVLTRDPALDRAVAQAAPSSSARSTSCRRRTRPSSSPAQVPAFEEAGWLIREDIQFHWENRGYADFDGFPRRAVLAQAQGHPQGARRRAGRRRDPAADGLCDRARRALGRILAVLPGHRAAQVGSAIPDPSGVHADGRAHGRRDRAGARLPRGRG